MARKRWVPLTVYLIAFAAMCVLSWCQARGTVGATHEVTAELQMKTVELELTPGEFPEAESGIFRALKAVEFTGVSSAHVAHAQEKPAADVSCSIGPSKKGLVYLKVASNGGTPRLPPFQHLAGLRWNDESDSACTTRMKLAWESTTSVVLSHHKASVANDCVATSEAWFLDPSDVKVTVEGSTQGSCDFPMGKKTTVTRFSAMVPSGAKVRWHFDAPSGLLLHQDVRTLAVFGTAIGGTVRSGHSIERKVTPEQQVEIRAKEGERLTVSSVRFHAEGGRIDILVRGAHDATIGGEQIGHGVFREALIYLAGLFVFLQLCLEIYRGVSK